MRSARTPWLVGLTVLACLSAAAVWWVGRPGDRVPDPGPLPVGRVTAPTTPAAPEVRVREVEVPAVEVLRRWDARRANAYAAGDVRALRGLYVARAGTPDLAVLRAYLRRGFRVQGMSMQLLGVRVLVATGSRVRLRVTDRLVGAVAVRAGERHALPRDTAGTRVVELSRAGPHRAWRMSSVVPR